MRKKLKPDLNLDTVQSDLIETVCKNYEKGISVRSLSKEFEISPMKTRKILITGGVYSTEMSTEIGRLYKDGKTVSEIADLLNTTPANVNSYLPYERIVYNMEERSVNADRQQRYRDHKRETAEKASDNTERLDQVNQIERLEKVKKMERVRTRTMLIIIGKKLRKMIPAGVYDDTSDPLARDKSYSWATNAGGEYVYHQAQDPDKMIWCAEVTVAGRGKNKKVGVVLESANCGFAVISSLPTAPELSTPSEEELMMMDWTERYKIEKQNKALLREYRETLEAVFISAIRDGLLAFSLPENRVLDYTDTIRSVELIKGRISTPAYRLEELIDRHLNWEAGDDPVSQYNICSNWTSRKFGNGDYRHVDAAVHKMLGMTEEESRKWLDDFLAPMREKLTAVSKVNP